MIIIMVFVCTGNNKLVVNTPKLLHFNKSVQRIDVCMHVHAHYISLHECACTFYVVSRHYADLEMKSVFLQLIFGLGYKLRNCSVV